MTDCPTGTYEAKGPSESSNRICRQITTCFAGTFQLVPPTKTSDRKCEPVSQCRPGEYVAKEATLFQDYVCSKCTIGVDYQDRFNTDAACKAVRRCGSDEEELRPPTIVADRVCTVKSESGDSGAASSDSASSNDFASSPLGVAIIAGSGLISAILPLVVACRYCGKKKNVAPEAHQPYEFDKINLTQMENSLKRQSLIGRSSVLQVFLPYPVVCIMHDPSVIIYPPTCLISFHDLVDFLARSNSTPRF